MNNLSFEQLACLEFTPANNPLDLTISGIDEVGRGALFGPVVAAAVLLQEQHYPTLISAGVTDSKQLSSGERERLVLDIHNVALDCQIGLASVGEIDRLNILQASLLAMKRAVLKLKRQPDQCLIDGNQVIPSLSIPQKAAIGGDRKFVAIAAASILAKVWRDAMIVRLASRYPNYDLAANKGYGTQRHRHALQIYGPSPLHRLSFKPCQLHPEPGKVALSLRLDESSSSSRF